MTIARPTLLGDYVPATIFGRASGRQTLAMNLARAAAPWVAALTVEATGNYAVLFAAVTTLALVAAAALLKAGRIRDRRT
ncbi:hypothetical protein [Cellulomonas hominis]|uniref:Major facilitator superfamily (MFS) profile domain-containing protein n=2 Tax=Cellulomonas hominis TaxID=156981 RepID=A0A7W8WC19_9CELL|nr:hypothetical protein [Cellulomonas hominis]MBB5475112.1 hypothetical protein [Cellulomonas hominis]NKY06765.1 hypothetical protein [Cellulomonas hominis]NKY10352.1 hypothetical protein [Cellulomonas hominis]